MLGAAMRLQPASHGRHVRYLIATQLFVHLLAATTLGVQSVAWAEDPPKLAQSWRIGYPLYPPPAGRLYFPWQIAIGPTGTVYVVDGGDRVQSFSPTGQFIASTGGRCVIPNPSNCTAPFNVTDCPSGMASPWGIAVSPSGAVYVADGNGRVCIYSEGLTFASAFGQRPGVCPDSPLWPVALNMGTPGWLALSPGGDIYRTDHYAANRRYVSKFSASGTFLGGWGGDLGSPAELSGFGNSFIKTDSAGRVFLPDANGTVMKVFTPDMQLIRSWPVMNAPIGVVSAVAAVALDSIPNVYLTLSDGTGVIYKYDEYGALLASWSVPPGLDFIYGLAVSRTGDVYATAYSGTNGASSRVLVYSYDQDSDGLLDFWERYGIDANDDGVIDYQLSGANPLHKDLYVEVDAMSGYGPSSTAMPMVVDAFARVPNALLTPPNPDGADGITLHIQVDETGLPVEPWADPPWTQFVMYKTKYFGRLEERADSNTVKAKKSVVRYCIFAKTFAGDTSGIANVPDTPINTGCYDFIVALGDPAWFPVTPEDEAGTFMHELGHCLGLDHGGADDDNGKPNYPSVMNYMWQTPWRVDGLSGPDKLAIENLRDSWHLDYSRQTLPTLFEDALNESSPIGPGSPDWTRVGPPCNSSSNLGQIVRMSGRIDWNRDGAIDAAPVQADANFDFHCGGVLTGHSDWGSLLFTPVTGPLGVARPAQSFLARALSSSQELSFSRLDSLSHMHFDCNGNGVADDVEIGNGSIADLNGNGVPDPCEALSQGGTTEVTLVMVRAEADADRVRIQWYAPGDNIVSISVFRREPDSDWMLLGHPLSDINHEIFFEDLNVTPGKQYGYRLMVRDVTGYETTADAWVTVPQGKTVPSALRFGPTHPNPFGGQGQLTYGLPRSGRVRLTIYDLQGRRVATLVDRVDIAGWRSVVWDGRDSAGRPVASGMYLARLEAAGGVRVQKIVVAR